MPSPEPNQETVAAIVATRKWRLRRMHENIGFRRALDMLNRLADDIERGEPFRHRNPASGSNE